MNDWLQGAVCLDEAPGVSCGAVVDQLHFGPVVIMLTIRQSQIDILGGIRRKMWEERMVGIVAHDYPNRYQDMGEPKVRELVQFAVKRGGEFGIDTETSLAVLIELMVAFGREFELSPSRAWARRMMGNPAAPADLRLHLMRERMMAATHGRAVVAHKFPSAGH